jgi:hypothetical protein
MGRAVQHPSEADWGKQSVINGRLLNIFRTMVRDYDRGNTAMFSG